jgi:hypothetical protein
MTFQPGQSGNPNGRPVGGFRNVDDLKRRIAKLPNGKPPSGNHAALRTIIGCVMQTENETNPSSPQQLRRLGDAGCNLSRLILSHQIRRNTSARLSVSILKDYRSYPSEQLPPGLWALTSQSMQSLICIVCAIVFVSSSWASAAPSIDDDGRSSATKPPGEMLVAQAWWDAAATAAQRQTPTQQGVQRRWPRR